DLTVTEYTRQFIQIGRYASYTMTTEELKTSLYILGLGSEFIFLIPSRRNGFLKVIDLAHQMEVDLKYHGLIPNKSRTKRNRAKGQSSGQHSKFSFGGRDYSKGSSQWIGLREARAHRQGQ